MPGPIKPQDVANAKRRAMPEAVFEAFNELIAENLVNGRAEVKQDDVVARMVAKGLNRSQIYAKGWLDVEEIYQAEGWHVSYDKPGYNETYPATFTFRKR